MSRRRLQRDDIPAAVLDAILRDGNPRYRRMPDGAVECLCGCCGEWQPATALHFYLAAVAEGVRPRYRSPCRLCDAEQRRRRDRAAYQRSRAALPPPPAASARPVVIPPAVPMEPPPRVRIPVAALPTALTGLRTCRHCDHDLPLDEAWFRRTAFGFASVCRDCTGDISHRAASLKIRMRPSVPRTED